jgi:hypothetical protein
MPRVIGAIDCTHIRVESPGGPNAEIFRNRKSFLMLKTFIRSQVRGSPSRNFVKFERHAVRASEG